MTPTLPNRRDITHAFQALSDAGFERASSALRKAVLNHFGRLGKSEMAVRFCQKCVPNKIHNRTLARRTTRRLFMAFIITSA